MILYLRDEVIGIGLDALTTDSREAHERYAETYGITVRSGPHRAAHAAEKSDEAAANLAAASDVLGRERIDHGYQIVHAAAMLDRCVAEGVFFCCSTSATLPSLAGHYGWGDIAAIPSRTRIGAGIRVTLSTDSSRFPGSDPGTESTLDWSTIPS